VGNESRVDGEAWLVECQPFRDQTDSRNGLGVERDRASEVTRALIGALAADGMRVAADGCIDDQRGEREAGRSIEYTLLSRSCTSDTQGKMVTLTQRYVGSSCEPKLLS